MISIDAGASTSYFHYDGLGSVVNLTSSSGSAQWTFAYEPFAVARIETKDDPAAPDNFLRFAGEFRDDTSLYHLRARQYDPAIGRFFSPDPLPPNRWESYPSTYIYAKNRPTVMIDPSGMGSVWSGSRTCTDWGTYAAGGVNVGYGLYKYAVGTAHFVAGPPHQSPLLLDEDGKGK